MLNPMDADIPVLFDQAGCSGQLCVLSLDGAQQVAVDADWDAMWEWAAQPLSAAAVFAQARRPWQDDAAIDAVIGTAAGAAVGRRRARD
jgi:hypothetical protein